MNDIPKIEMLTAEETHIRSGLAKCHIYRMVADGSIVSIRAGRKILINYNSVLAYLSTGIPQGAACREAVHKTENTPRIAPISLR